MSELIRAWLFVFLLSMTAFGFTTTILPTFVTFRQFKLWRNLWLIVVTLAFVLGNIWLFVALFLLFVMLILPKQPTESVLFYLLLLCALPMLSVVIPFVGIQYLFELNYPRLLCICFLLLQYFRSRLPTPLFSLKPDFWVMAFLLLISFASYRDNTFSNALREIFLYILDIFIPYCLLSRFLSNTSQLNRAFLALAIGLLPTVFVAIAETIKHWHLYKHLTLVLTGKPPLFSYDVRGGTLRATSIFKGPIILGYAMLLELGLLLYLKPLIKNPKIYYLLLMMSGLALLSSVARGPWIAAALAFAVFLWTGPNPIKSLTIYFISTLGGLYLLSLTEAGHKFIDLLPFIGSIRSDTIDYRAKLLEVSWVVFQKKPLFGDTNFIVAPEMGVMLQGQGIIDIVNSYVNIALKYGIVGLFLFLAIFFTLMLNCLLTIKRLPSSETELVRMGRVLLAILSGTALTIFTTSSIDYIPVLYWALIGISAAYLNVAKKAIQSHRKAVIAGLNKQQRA